MRRLLAAAALVLALTATAPAAADAVCGTYRSEDGWYHSFTGYQRISPPGTVVSATLQLNGLANFGSTLYDNEATQWVSKNNDATGSFVQFGWYWFDDGLGWPQNPHQFIGWNIGGHTYVSRNPATIQPWNSAHTFTIAEYGSTQYFYFDGQPVNGYVTEAGPWGHFDALTETMNKYASLPCVYVYDTFSNMSYNTYDAYPLSAPGYAFWNVGPDYFSIYGTSCCSAAAALTANAPAPRGGNGNGNRHARDNATSVPWPPRF